jgi:hypothetical protein
MNDDSADERWNERNRYEVLRKTEGKKIMITQLTAKIQQLRGAEKIALLGG